VQRATLNIYQGDDYAATVTVYRRGMPVEDLDVYTPRAQIREDVADRRGKVVAEMTAAVSMAPGASMILLSLTHAQTTVVRSGDYVWDLQLEAPDGAIITTMAGAARITPEVTR